MGAGDVLKGLLAVGAGGLTGYAEAKDKKRSEDFKRQMKDMELEIKRENILRMRERDAWQQERSMWQNLLTSAQANQTNALTGPKVHSLEAGAGLAEARTADIPLDTAIARSIADSMNAYRAGSLEARMKQIEDDINLNRRLYGVEGGPETPYGPPGAKIGPGDKVVTGSSASGKVVVPYHVKLYIKELEDAREPWLRSYQKVLESHPEVYEQVIENAGEKWRANPVNKNRTMTMRLLQKSDEYRQAIEEAKEDIAKTESGPPELPPLRPDFMRLHNMLTGPQAP